MDITLENSLCLLADKVNEELGFFLNLPMRELHEIALHISAVFIIFPVSSMT